MNLETKEKDSLIILVIVNFLIWFPVLLIIFFFLAVSRVYAQPQYRTSTGSWGSWTDLTLENNYQFATNTSTSWSSYIQLKDTVAFDNNKTYNLYATFEVKLTQSGTREIFSAIDPYIYNGSTLTSVSDKCTVSGTRSDKTTSSPITATTHTYKGSISCVGLTNQGYYPYLTFRFYSTVAMPTAFQFKIDRWEYHVGSDSTDANNIMNNANQNTQQIIESYNEATQNIIQNNIDLANNLVETIENQNKVCNDYHLGNETLDGENGYFTSTGEIAFYNNWYYTTDYIPINQNTEYKIIKNYTNNSDYCLYDSNKRLIGNCSSINSYENTINSGNAYYIRYDGSKQSSRTTQFEGTYCYDYREKETEQMDELLNGWNKANDPDYSNTDEAFDLESDLLDNMDLDFSNINIEVNTTSNNLIWTWITNILFGNTVLSLAVITLLLLNLIRFIIGR